MKKVISVEARTLLELALKKLLFLTQIQVIGLWIDSQATCEVTLRDMSLAIE